MPPQTSALTVAAAAGLGVTDVLGAVLGWPISVFADLESVAGPGVVVMDPEGEMMVFAVRDNSGVGGGVVAVIVVGPAISVLTLLDVPSCLS
jgi:hypothetical protein